MNSNRTVGAALRLSVWIAALSPLVAGSASAANPVDNVTATITDSAPGKVLVPKTFAGMFDASNISKGIFDSTLTKSSEYQNLIQEMQVTHYRVEGAPDSQASNYNQVANFFNFLKATGAPQPCLMWGLWLYRDPDLGGDNLRNALTLMQDSTDAPYIDAFAFGNEIQYNQNIDRDKYVSGYSSNKSSPPNPAPHGLTYLTAPQPYVGAREYWEQQHAWVNQTLSGNGITLPAYMGCDAGDSLPDGSDYQVKSFKDGKMHTWFLSFAIDEAASLKAATQHMYVGSGGTIPAYGTATWLPGAPTSAFPNGMGIPYALGDLVSVIDPTTGETLADPNTKVPLYYQYIATTPHVFHASDPTPQNDTTHWQSLEPNFIARHAYHIGDIVRDQLAVDNSNPAVAYPGTLYQCVIAQNSVDHPSLAVKNATANNYPCMWVLTDPTQFTCQGPHQLALNDLHTQRQTDWGTILKNRLGGGTPGWPTINGAPLPFRMTEFSPYSGPQNGGWIDNGTDINYGNYKGLNPDPVTGSTAITWYDSYYVAPPGTQLLVAPGANPNAPLAARQHTDNFASALIGLEMFHYWAGAGAIGVNPEEGVGQMNSPIMEGLYGQPMTDFRALPFAYVWPAFNIGAQPSVGRELPVSTIGLNPSPLNQNSDNFSVYAVDTPTDLFVTIINKSFAYNNDGTHLDGARDLEVTLSLGSFVPSGFLNMELVPGDGTNGDSTSEGSAKLGGTTLNAQNTALFTPTWDQGSTPAAWHGAPFKVDAFSAMIIDLKK